MPFKIIMFAMCFAFMVVGTFGILTSEYVTAHFGEQISFDFEDCHDMIESNRSPCEIGNGYMLVKSGFSILFIIIISLLVCALFYFILQLEYPRTGEQDG